MSGLRAKLIEAGARTGLSLTFDSLHSEDQEGYRVNAAEQLDAFLDCLAENSDEWSAAAVRRHPFGKGPVSTPKTVVEHAIAVLRESADV